VSDLSGEDQLAPCPYIKWFKCTKSDPGSPYDFPSDSDIKDPGIWGV
jgi:hypothetical protein